MDCPRPQGDTGIGVHSDPNAYMKPADPHGYVEDLWNHKVRWFLHWYYDQNSADFIKIMRERGIEVIGRPGPAKMPRPSIDMAVVEAYIAAGVRWFVAGNEWNLFEEWDRDNNWAGLEKPIRMCADQWIRYADAIRERGAWVLTPPPSLGGHWLHRDWFQRFIYALGEIAIERGQTFEQLMWHCGIGIHCRSVGNPLTAGPSDYDCSAREWEWFAGVVKAAQTDKNVVIPIANTEAFDEPQWLPKVGNDYDWGLWQDRNVTQMHWFDPNNPGYRYPLQVICNCFWVIHADRFSPWPQCGLRDNYPHYLQKGDYTTDLWREMADVITWQRGEPQPQPPQPEPEPEPMPSEIEYVGLSQEMKDALRIDPPTNPAAPYWKIRRIEIQPECDKQSIYAILPAGTPFQMQMFWADGQSEWVSPKADQYEPEGARAWAASYPVFRGGWGAYGMRLNVNAESLWGVGLYEKQDNQIIISMTGHHPTLVYFQLVQPDTAPEPPVVPPDPPVPPVVPSIPYEFGSALSARLVAAGLGRMVDLRQQVEDKWKGPGQPGIRSVDADKRVGNFWSITLHHTGYTGPLDILGANGIGHLHTVTRGWARIGYDLIIDKAGTVWWTKKLMQYGPHCGNERFNKYSIPVTVHGDFTSESPSVAQLRALKCVTDTLEEWVGEHQGKAQPLPIVRHKDIVNTACPGSLYEAYRKHVDK